MNKGFDEAEDFLLKLDETLEENPVHGVRVIVCPPYPYLELATDIAQEGNFHVGAQNLYPVDFGAFTGEISAAILQSLEVEYCIIGHSERRKYFGESHAFLAEKVKAALKNGIIPIFCCGEVLDERERGVHLKVVEDQLNESLFFVKPEEMEEIVIAYEPVWAIGTGVNASPEQAQEMHAYIRSLVSRKFGKKVGDNTVILYGGSCNAANARDLFSQPDVDGGLIGGASLKIDEFLKILQSFD